MNTSRQLLMLIALLSVAACTSERDTLELTSELPSGTIPRSGVIELTFSRGVARSELQNVWTSDPYIEFSPAIPGKFVWQDSVRLVFSPDAHLPGDARFTGTINTGLLVRISGDTETCTYYVKGKGSCRACEKFCQTGAIDFEQPEQLIDLEVGTIILATGFKDFDPVRIPQYGYGELENVLTSMEFERMINSGGPTGGQVRLKDGRRPENVAIIHCVGSRDEKYHVYCSRVCCMYSLKLAQLTRDYVGAKVVEYYRDMRAFGKDYEAFYERVGRAGAQFNRFDHDLTVSRHNGQLKVSAIDVYNGQMKETFVHMVVLRTGLEPRADQARIAQIFGISLTPDGFFLEKHPKLAPVETTTDGVFLAGTCQGI